MRTHTRVPTLALGSFHCHTLQNGCAQHASRHASALASPEVVFSRLPHSTPDLLTNTPFGCVLWLRWCGGASVCVWGGGGAVCVCVCVLCGCVRLYIVSHGSCEQRKYVCHAHVIVYGASDELTCSARRWSWCRGKPALVRLLPRKVEVDVLTSGACGHVARGHQCHKSESHGPGQ
jgi:hypothetical protein